MDFYKYKMSRFLKDRVFSPCRGKAEMVVRLAEIMAELCFTPEVDRDPDLVIAVGKTQRMFVVSTGKIFSVQFPFAVKRAAARDLPNQFYMLGIEIDNYVLSRVSAIVYENFMHMDNDVYSLMENVLTEHSVAPNAGAQTYQEAVWKVLKAFLMMEDGYLRYDNDPANADAEFHPLNHLDVFYSPGCTFKIGLDRTVDNEALMDILNPQTKCRSIVV